MIFNGRHYESGNFSDAEINIVGISCGRPITVEERCEMTASLMALHAKEDTCVRLNALTHSSCVGSHFTYTDKLEVEAIGKKTYTDAYTSCISLEKGNPL